MQTVLDRVAAALEAFRKGEIVVVTDDDDREDEGDLFVAASLCTPEKMALIIRHTSGIVCAPMTEDEARRLRLDPMVGTNDAPQGTAFTVSVDFKHGLKTGISAEERTNTVRALANGNTAAADFARPGHVFPLIARPGGVLTRSGHTEACVDMCTLAGLRPVGVLAELVNDDGTVMRGLQVAAFAEKRRLHCVSVADLIAYRQAREKLVTRVSAFCVETNAGPFQGYAYRTSFDPVFHFALVHGEVAGGHTVLARLHRGNAIHDAFGPGRKLDAALQAIVRNGAGVLVYLRDGAAGVPVSIPFDDGETESEKSRLGQWRDIGVGAQILRDLDVSSVRLLSTAPHLSYVGLSGFGITIESVEALSGDE
jgi:3,4-dihydroxy 2-butanone 4-phosphate synthase / GTP cyclohydrolase II